jgi:hypothetical protein
MRKLAAPVAWILAAAYPLAAPYPLTAEAPAPGPVATAAETLLLPGAANIIGTHSSRWRSDLTLRNPGSDPVEVRVFFLRTGGANDLASAPHHDYFLIAGEVKEMRNVLGADFGIAGTGALLATTAQQLFPNNPPGAAIWGTLRTATSVRFSKGEPGPPIPAAEPVDADRQVLSGLKHDGAGEKGVRAAVAVVNLSRSQGISVKVEILDEAGELLGEQGLHAGPLSVNQQPVAVRFASGVVRFTRVEGSGPFVAYGTTVDNATEESAFRYAVPEPGRPAAPLRLSFDSLVEPPAPGPPPER